MALPTAQSRSFDREARQLGEIRQFLQRGGIRLASVAPLERDAAERSRRRVQRKGGHDGRALPGLALNGSHHLAPGAHDVAQRSPAG